MQFEAVRISGPAGELTGWTHWGSDADAVPILFLHPINMQGRIWFQLAEALGSRRTMVMPDLRAHGTSDSDGEFGLDEWLSDIVAFVDEFLPGRRMHVVGGSLGGSLAVCFAALRPESVVSITAIGSSLNFVGTDAQAVLDEFDKYGIPGTFERVFPKMTFGPDVAPEVIELGLSLANPNPVEIVKRVWSATVFSDSTDRAGDVRCPSLILTGQYDLTCTPERALHMAEALNTEVVLLPGIGHMPMLENPDRIAVLIETHLGYAEQNETP